jgi:hypothetical protein
MITYIPAGIEIPWEGIENGAKTNNDGHGWAIASAMGLEVGKSMDFTEAALDLEAARERHGMNSVVLFHSRWGTHGVMGEFNVHPFYVGDDRQTVMAHNGILPSAYHPVGKDPRSDTRIFTDRVAGNYLNPDSGVPSRRRGKSLGDVIGSGNKLAFLSIASGTPKVRIINAWMGEWEGGVWYSNTGYKARRFWGGSTYTVGSRTVTAGSCGTSGRSSQSVPGGWAGWGDGEDDWDPTWQRRYEEWKTEHGFGDPATDSEAAREAIIDGQVVDLETLDSAQCEFCGEVDAVDTMIDICANCETCQTCGDIAADCMCYSIPHQQKPSHLFVVPELPSDWQPEPSTPTEEEAKV